MTLLPRWPLLFALSLFFVSVEARSPAPETTGIKVTVKFGDSDRRSEQVIYLQNDHRRTEYRDEYNGNTRDDGASEVRYGPRIAAITRCDLGQRFELNLADGQFEAWPIPQTGQTKEEAVAAAQRPRTPQTSPAGGPILRIETTTSDTGERKNFFGHVARHVITTVKQTALDGSQRQPLDLTTDAWYIDLETRLSCEPWATSGVGVRAIPAPAMLADKKVEFVEKGVPANGFAVESKNTWHGVMKQVDGTQKEISFSQETNITQFAEGTLDPALFEVPPGFRKVQQIDRNPPMTLTEAWSSTRQWFKDMTKQLVP